MNALNDKFQLFFSHNWTDYIYDDGIIDPRMLVCTKCKHICFSNLENNIFSWGLAWNISPGYPPLPIPSCSQVIMKKVLE